MLAQTPVKIISGGQTGADRAALDFAIVAQIKHGGWCPAGRRSEDGRIPEHYHLTETAGWGYEDRTERNVRDADATLIFNRGHTLSPGSATTLRCCERHGRPYRVVRVPGAGQVHDLAAVGASAREVAEFIAQHQPKALNVAGNRERTTPGIGDFVKQVLAQAWQIVPSIEAGLGQQHELFELRGVQPRVR